MCNFFICKLLEINSTNEYMLYTRQQLNQKEFVSQALEKYLDMFLNHRNHRNNKNKMSKLKWHERDFFFENLQTLRNDKNQPVFDILSIPEAKDYVLYKLILIYASNGIIDFSKKSFDYDGRKITKKEKKKDAQIFYRLLADWTKELKDGKGQYLMVIRPLYEKKKKELQDLKTQKKIDPRTFVQRCIYMRATFYHVYYHVRKYFDEMKSKTETCIVCGIVFFVDIYSHAHILTRHYYPQMNHNIGGSLNENIPVLDICNLPSSLLELIKRYAEKKAINTNTEYLLFVVDGKKYILWMRYGKIALLGNLTGMEIRSFYHCDKQRDLEKFNGKTIIKIDEHLSIAT